MAYSISLANAATPWWLSVPVIRRSLLGWTRLTVAPASLAMAVKYAATAGAMPSASSTVSTPEPLLSSSVTGFLP